MRIEQLEYIAAVTQHGSLRRASERLHISQPALSEAVRSLERELGVTLLDRRRSGSRISLEGQNLLQNMTEVLDSVSRLRSAAAGDANPSGRIMRVGTVSAGTAPLLVPAIRDFREANPGTVIEVVNSQQSFIQQALTEGSLDLGLVNILPGDDIPPELHATPLLRGYPVVCCRMDNPLAALDEISLEDLRSEPFVAMRAGYVMHRFAHRLFGSDPPKVSYATDGAEMGKLLVAGGLGVTLLPDYSVAGDHLERVGIITSRPLAGDRTTVSLIMLHRRNDRPPRAIVDLSTLLVDHARSRGAAKGSTQTVS